MRTYVRNDNSGDGWSLNVIRCCLAFRARHWTTHVNTNVNTVGLCTLAEFDFKTEIHGRPQLLHVCLCTSACACLTSTTHYQSFIILIVINAQCTCSSWHQLPLVPATFQRHVPTAVQSTQNKNDHVWKTAVTTTWNIDSFTNTGKWAIFNVVQISDFVLISVDTCGLCVFIHVMSIDWHMATCSLLTKLRSQSWEINYAKSN